MSEDKSFLKRLLTETWPALDRGNFGTMSAAEGADLGPTAIDNLFRSTANHLGKSALKAVMLPGDVYQGKVSIYDDDGRPNPEVIERAFDLAGLVTLGAGAVPAEANSLRSGIKAYHGSPHDFGRFDLSKIGTGEGAQAYGHGLYFAENEGVARGYRDALSPGMREDALRSVGVGNSDLQAMRQFTQSTVSPDIALRDWLGWVGKKETPEIRAAFMKEWEARNPGHMYEVAIKADPEHFLDWDKPLSEQGPKVQDGLRKLWGSSYERRIADPYNSHGQDLAARTMDPVNGRAYTQELRQAGIPGIKYLDQGSRGAGEGSRNYVVFDDKIIDILKKYGLAGATASPLAALMASQGQGELQQ